MLSTKSENSSLIIVNPVTGDESLPVFQYSSIIENTQITGILRMKSQTDVRLELIDLSRRWAEGKSFDAAKARDLRRQALILNHGHYAKNIPVYRKVVYEAGNIDVTDSNSIKKHFMLSSDIFKSYDPAWLDRLDFNRMTNWLSGLCDRPITAAMDGVTSIDTWIDRLDAQNIKVVYSSGTSGVFSFVPKSAADRTSSTIANIAFLVPMLAERMGGNVISKHIVKNAVQSLSIESLPRLVKKGLPGFDAAFLAFRQGKMGNQVLIQELAPFFENSYFLFDLEITGTALRCIRRGPGNETEQRLLEAFQKEVVDNRDLNYLRLIKAVEQSTLERRKIFMFGAPFQFKELCEYMAVRQRKVPLRKGSLIFFGGGWKSFAGDSLDSDSLVKAIAENFAISPDSILEGYSMSEINTLMIRCKKRRFHVPPTIEPAVFDDALNPVEGNDITGSFGFLDPFASSYPGFIITNDYVRLVAEGCECGLPGPGILSIQRLPGSEIKGCGGIMSSFTA